MRAFTRLAVWLALVPVVIAGCGDSPPVIDEKRAAAEQEAEQKKADDEERQNIKDRRQERTAAKPKS